MGLALVSEGGTSSPGEIISNDMGVLGSMESKGEGGGVEGTSLLPDLDL